MKSQKAIVQPLTEDGSSFVIGTRDLMIRVSSCRAKNGGVEIRGAFVELAPNVVSWGVSFQFRGTRDDLSNLAGRGAKVMRADPRFSITDDVAHR